MVSILFCIFIAPKSAAGVSADTHNVKTIPKINAFARIFRPSFQINFKAFVSLSIQHYHYITGDKYHQ